MDSELSLGGTVSTVLSFMALALLSIICIVHALRMYQDLYTDERKSVLHRRLLPDRNESFYKIIAWFTFMSVTCLVISRYFHLLWIMIWTYAESSQTCVLLTLINVFNYHVAQIFVYWVFLLRLRTTYGNTSFAYNIRWLNFWTVFIVLYKIINLSMVFSGFIEMNGCKIVLNKFIYASIGMTLLFEFAGSIGFMVAFIIPLKGIKNYVEEQYSTFSEIIQQQNKKLFYVAVKTTTLTSIIAITPLFSIGVTVIAKIDMLWLHIPIICISLILMTPYYDDAIYYQKMCWCCIKCCTPKHAQYKSKQANDQREAGMPSVLSADTMDQVKVSARDANMIQIGQSNEDKTPICAETIILEVANDI